MIDALKKSIIVFSSLVVLSSYLLGGTALYSVKAAGATLSLSPSSGTFGSSATITMKVVLASGGGVGVNAADGKIAFDPAYLQIVGLSKEGSIFNLWTSEPAYSNSAGTINFSGGSNTAYTGDSGLILTVVFKAQKSGATTIKFSSGSALAADGQGTNILGTMNSADITLGGAAAPPSAPPPQSSAPPQPSSPAAPPPAPFQVDIAINSPTHPDPGKWYANNNPQFTWTATPDVAGVSTAFDQTPDSFPRRRSEGLIGSKQYNNIAEGIWYFHIRFVDSLGNWSEPIHKRIQIDMTPPSQFSIDVQNGAGPQGRTVLQFHATDTVSGVDHYEVTFDGEDPLTASLNDVENGYTAPPLLPGQHSVVVRAVDQAGNGTDAHAEFSLPGIPVPKITNYPSTVLEQSPVIVEGVADSGSNVTLDVYDKDSKVFAEGKMIADQSGHWLHVIEGGLPTGKYSLGVSMITSQGAESSSTDKLTMQVIPRPFMERFGWLVIVFLMIAIAGLIAYGFYRKKLIDLKFMMADAEITDIRMKTKAVFEALREEVDEKVNLMEGGAAHAAGEGKLEPEHVLDALKNALSVSEDTIEKEIDDIERALQDPPKQSKGKENN